MSPPRALPCEKTHSFLVLLFRKQTTSKAKSGTRADYQRQLAKMEKTARAMLEKHQSADAAPTEVAMVQRDAKKLQRLQNEAAKLRDWLQANPNDRKGSRGSVILSNRTDNESAKMATGKGADIVLRSKTPELVRQEFRGLLLAHHVVRQLMLEAALSRQRPPESLSFKYSLTLIQRKLPASGAIPP